MYFTEVKPAGIVDLWGSQTRGRLVCILRKSTAEEGECS